MTAAPGEITRVYRRRKAALQRLQERLRIERRNWHAVWTAQEVPSWAVRDLIDELCDLADVEGE